MTEAREERWWEALGRRETEGGRPYLNRGSWNNVSAVAILEWSLPALPGRGHSDKSIEIRSMHCLRKEGRRRQHGGILSMYIVWPWRTNMLGPGLGAARHATQLSRDVAGRKQLGVLVEGREGIG